MPVSERTMRKFYGASGYVDPRQRDIDLIRRIRELLAEFGRSDLDTFADIALIMKVHIRLVGEGGEGGE